MSNLDKTKAIEALRAGDCPFCGRSGFRVPLVHVSHIHKINRKEIRDLLGLTYTEHLLPPGIHEFLSHVALLRGWESIKNPSTRSGGRHSIVGRNSRNGPLSPKENSHE